MSRPKGQNQEKNHQLRKQLMIFHTASLPYFCILYQLENLLSTPKGLDHKNYREKVLNSFGLTPFTSLNAFANLLALSYPKRPATSRIVSSDVRR